VLPCVDVFVADEFCVWATILQTCLALRWGAQLADVRTCLAFALQMYAGAPNLWTSIAFRWGAQLPDVPCVALGCPTCGRALCCRFRCRCILHLGDHLADVPCVALGCPTCGHALRCVGAPNLGEAVLKSLPPSQKNFLSILQLIFLPSAPLCGRFHCR
jgi:hypothetical protein